MHELGPFTFWELMALSIVVPLVLGVAGVWGVHHRLTHRVGEGHNDVLVPIYSTAAIVYAVLLAFTVIAVWEQYTSAKDNVADETSGLATMYRQTEAVPPQARAQLRKELRDYTEAVIGPEWRIQQGGNASPLARAELLAIYRTIARQPPRVTASAIEPAFLSELSKTTADRTKRLLASQDALPWILWMALLAGGLVVVVMSWFLYMDRLWLHAAMSALTGALLGARVFTTFALDRPFQGKLGIRPDAFEHNRGVYAQVDASP